MGSSKAALTAFLSLLGVASAAVAEPPSGNYVIEVGGEDMRLTLARGDAEVCEVEPQGEICVTTTAATGASGGVYGVGVLTLTGELEGEIAFQFEASTRGTLAKPVLRKPTIHGYGVISDGLISFDVQMFGRMKCKLDAAQPDEYACKAKTRLCAIVEGQKIDCTSISYHVSLAAEKAPPFHVNLALATDSAGVITGTAEAIVDVGVENAHPVTFIVTKGKYDASRDSAKIDFRVSVGRSYNDLTLKAVVFEAGIATSGDMKFDLGQKGRYRITPPP
jgi:hypothetical protein